MNEWRYDEDEIMFYHENIPMSCFNVVNALNAAEARGEDLEGKVAELNKEIEELKELCAWALESSLRYLNAWEEEIKRNMDK